METSKNHLIRNFLRNGRVSVNKKYGLKNKSWRLFDENLTLNKYYLDAAMNSLEVFMKKEEWLRKRKCKEFMKEWLESHFYRDDFKMIYSFTNINIVTMS